MFLYDMIFHGYSWIFKIVFDILLLLKPLDNFSFQENFEPSPNYLLRLSSYFYSFWIKGNAEVETFQTVYSALQRGLPVYTMIIGIYKPRLAQKV